MYIVHTFLLSLCTEPMCVIGVVFWYNVNGECVEECKTWKARCERPTTKRAHNGMSEVCMKWIQTNRISHKLWVFLSFSVATFFSHLQKCAWSAQNTRIHINRGARIQWTNETVGCGIGQSQQLNSNTLVKWISAQTVCYDTHHINSFFRAFNTNRKKRSFKKICGMFYTWFRFKVIALRRRCYWDFISDLHMIKHVLETVNYY